MQVVERRPAPQAEGLRYPEIVQAIKPEVARVIASTVGARLLNPPTLNRQQHENIASLLRIKTERDLDFRALERLSEQSRRQHFQRKNQQAGREISDGENNQDWNIKVHAWLEWGNRYLDPSQKQLRNSTLRIIGITDPQDTGRINKKAQKSSQQYTVFAQPENFNQKYLATRSNIHDLVADIAEACRRTPDAAPDLTTLEMRLHSIANLLSSFGEDYSIPKLIAVYAKSYGLLAQPQTAKQTIAERTVHQLTQPISDPGVREGLNAVSRIQQTLEQENQQEVERDREAERQREADRQRVEQERQTAERRRAEQARLDQESEEAQRREQQRQQETAQQAEPSRTRQERDNRLEREVEEQLRLRYFRKRIEGNYRNRFEMYAALDEAKRHPENSQTMERSQSAFNLRLNEYINGIIPTYPELNQRVSQSPYAIKGIIRFNDSEYFRMALKRLHLSNAEEIVAHERAHAQSLRQKGITPQYQIQLARSVENGNVYLHIQPSTAFSIPANMSDDEIRRLLKEAISAPGRIPGGRLSPSDLAQLRPTQTSSFQE